MDWMLPGLAPTGKRVEVAVAPLPVVGVESARKAIDPSLSSNKLIDRT
ncbi:hypothetical protein [Chroococcidiopsis sp [FACHB-1243]]|nr:hypothetical protein [Chroococcidiopsis sp. [FACHB-1243]]